MFQPEQDPAGSTPAPQPSPAADDPARDAAATDRSLNGANQRPADTPVYDPEPELAGMPVARGCGEAESDQSGTHDAPEIDSAWDDDGGGDDNGHDQPEHRRYGFFPFWRAWQGAWWWEGKPWDLAHVFLCLLLSANRKPRTTRYLHRVIQVDRGCVATSFEALAGRSGLSRKVITRMVRDLADAGEIEVLDKGQCGVLLKVVRYDAYALPPKERDGARRSGGTDDEPSDGQRRHGGGTAKARRRDTPRYGRYADTDGNGERGEK